MDLVYFITLPVLFPLARLLVRVLGRMRTSGEGNVPARGGFIYCPNHISDADPVAFFVAQPRRAWFIGKQELFDIPVLGWFFYHFHAFPIRRDTADRAALRRAEACLRRGEPILLFPEGRCSQTGRLQHIQSGAALLAVRADVPIVPIGIEHTNEMLPYGSLVPRFSRHPVSLTFGPAIRPEAFAHLKHGDAVEAITRKLGDELARLTHQAPPPAPEARGRRPRPSAPGPASDAPFP
jgi:1-acyl-sn-glycerol-3-phosphate acyltransferase